MTRRILAPGALAGTLTRWLIAGLFGLSAFPVSDVHAASCKQPVYIIAHRCNDPNDGPQTVAAEGVNAIEADFSWGSRWPGITDDEWAVDHEGVYPHSTYLSNWLTDVSAEVHTPGTTLSLIIFDIKDPEGDLLLLYKEARKALGPDINLIFSIGSYGGREEFKNIRDVINADQRAGVALDQNTSPSAAADFFKNAPINKYWFGDGIAAGALEPDSVQFHTFAAMGIRDSEADCSAFHGVYTWTYEEEDRVKFYLDHGVNGIFVNAPTCNGYANPGGPEVIAPKDVVAYAKNLPNRKFATPEDNPFEYVKPEIVCPVSATIECSSPGGAKATDPQASSFLNVATCDNENCDTVTISNNGAAFFPVNSATPVTFTATADSPCSPSGQCQATLTVKDTTAPTPTCPADIALDPMTPQGSVATFSVSAADVCDVAAQVTCDRASGSTFGIGTTTTVTCTAKDASNNTQSCSFSVKVKTPQEVVNDLKATAASLSGSLNNGQMNSLMSLLDALLASINASNTSSTCGQLLGLISNINGWVTNGALSAAQAKPFIDSAKNLQKTFGCT